MCVSSTHEETSGSVCLDRISDRTRYLSWGGGLMYRLPICVLTGILHRVLSPDLAMYSNERPQNGERTKNVVMMPEEGTGNV